METRGVSRNPAGADIPASPRAEVVAQAGAVRTELAPGASVQQAAASEAVRFQPSEANTRRAALDAALREVIRRYVALDPKSREVVFQTVDRRTGEVVRQIPDELLLKLRAYAREMREADSAGRPQVKKTV